ncbi:helix-turn-helix domain-containing protein [Paenibacillus naphthalenovorans]|uniref:helix-turn-helix domain-containing protein n=1 Tax=Paenibacillus naphthalenovorans TaxID=162209 RepID=UPI003D280FEF
MLTQFGKFCRKLRIDNGELLKEMADKLGVTSSYLSAVENGKRNVPHDWLETITDLYSLSQIQKKELNEAIEESQLTIKMELKDYNNSEKNLIMSFAREFKDLDEENRDKIRNILLNHKKGGV